MRRFLNSREFSAMNDVNDGEENESDVGEYSVTTLKSALLSPTQKGI